MYKRISLISITFFWLALACTSISNLSVQEERNPLLEGEFDVTGVNPDGRAYFGLAEIVYSRGNYVVTWEISGETIMGAGVWENEQFTVVYDGGQAIYSLDEFGNLTGTWFLEGETETGSETLAPRTLTP
jgi:hypothetical protein